MNSEISIKVVSSSGDTYDVLFKFSDDKFSVLCHCPAGIYGKLCKHKTGLLDGDHLNLPQFNGHFKKYTKEYTINEEGVSNEKKETSI